MEFGQFEDYFKEQMKQQADYDGVFWPKSRSKTMAEKDRRVVDGCATFFKASKYVLQAVVSNEEAAMTNNVYVLVFDDGVRILLRLHVRSYVLVDLFFYLIF